MQESAAEKTAKEYFEAIRADDMSALKHLMTQELYATYVKADAQSERVERLLSFFGKESPSPGQLELVSVTCDKVAGSTAYVNIETRLGEMTRYERMILKSVDGRWRIAGRQ